MLILVYSIRSKEKDKTLDKTHKRNCFDQKKNSVKMFRKGRNFDMSLGNIDSVILNDFQNFPCDDSF